MMGELIIRSLHKSFGTAQALQPTDLTVRAGSFTTLLGPSGCGKTTLLRMIAGLEEPDGGEIYVQDQCFYSSARRESMPVHQRQLGMVFQDFALWPHMTVFENVAFGLRARKRKEGLREAVQEALRTVRLEGLEQRLPHQLSGGQQQRVAFARAIAVSPRLILFDEPLSALDAVLRDEMRGELMRLVRQLGMTALYVTHDQTEAMSMSDDVIVMKQGQVLQRGTPEHIYRAPSHPFVARFIGRSNWLEPDRLMVRPEHLRWSKGAESDQRLIGRVAHASYIGDRYELGLEMERGGDMWIAYADRRLQPGEMVELYVSEDHIHCVVESSSEEQ